MPKPRQTPPTQRLLRGRRAYAAGQGAEALAAEALAAEGWTLLGQRIRTGAGEIDLIAERQGLLAFIEVKARPSLAEAAFALGPRQRARLIVAAEAWLAEHPGHGAAGMRFDVMLVAADGTIRRIADAFRVEES
ncbi:MAG: YraN family protein [Roseomonas sp.]|nr:YraN family protein [Roseomonas sp.]